MVKYIIIDVLVYVGTRVTGENPPDKSPSVKGQVSLGFRPRAFHRRANVGGVFT